MTELWEDWLESHPGEQLRREVHEASGQAYYQVGDPVVDRWERQIAEGQEPDFDEGLTAEQRRAEARRLGQVSGLEEEAGAFSGFEERFDR